MKRIASFLLVLALLIPCAALADFDLSGMTFDELAALRNAINAEMMERGYEKKVNVPAGTYTVGEDIPAGAYTISTNAIVVMFYVIDPDGSYAEMHTLMPAETIGKITVAAGQSIQIAGGTVAFTPYVGLGF